MLKMHNMMLGQHNDLLDQSLRCALLTDNHLFVRTSKTDCDQTVWMPRLICVPGSESGNIFVLSPG